jgi:hypothetical protein
LCAADIIQYLALPGQTITIQITDLEGMTNFMKSNGNSEAVIEFMTNHVEELYAADFISFLALPGQTITIQITDLEFSNTEHEMTT